MQAIVRANELQTYDAAYVESILLQERRRKELPSPTPLRPKRQELIEEIETDEPDLETYDHLFNTEPESESKQEPLENGEA